MISAKDTFYLVLRNRIAALNPARTMGLRGVTRPGVLVEENELATAEALPDVFRLRWTAVKLDTQGSMPLATMTCEIRYATAGNAGNGGMDRGRVLAQMDAELRAALSTTPQHAPKQRYTANSTQPTAMATNIFWSDAVFGATATDAERLERTATVQVYSYEEAGE
ncbi:MAG TPA: hypothetical protein VGC07_06670 [Granulicella sp.]